jgi:hypothetical protein
VFKATPRFTSRRIGAQSPVIAVKRATEMSKLDQEARVTIKTLLAKRVSHCAVARMLQVTEGTVRYQAKRMAVMAVDGRSRQSSKATGWAEAIGHWREQQGDGVINLAALHD